MQYDGKPLADQKVEITEAVWTSDRKPHVETLLTDEQGHAVFKLQDAGTWVPRSGYGTTPQVGGQGGEISNSTAISLRDQDQYNVTFTTKQSREKRDEKDRGGQQMRD